MTITTTIRDFAQVREPEGLNELIEALMQLRDSLPDAAAADVRFKGDDLFGRRICVSWLREKTADEIALDARYASAHVEPLSRAA
ncbi:MAG: hypothetical protein ABJA20_11325 [Novosphingobium sp.]